MARPQKCGMDYFPHDTDALTDEKIEALRMLYGNDGYAFYFILLERIYRTENFELDVSDSETIQILSRKIGITEESFNKMLCTALKRNCFDNNIYNDRKCLTSAGIKKRADVVISKRIASKESYGKRVSATETKQEINQETTPESTQRKGKERKEENNKHSLADIELIVARIRKELPKDMTKTSKMARDKLPKLIKEHGEEELINSVKNYIQQIKKDRVKFPEKNYMNESTFWNGRYMDFINCNETQKQVLPLIWDDEVDNE